MSVQIREALDGEAGMLAELIRKAFRDVADRFGLTPENCPSHPSNCTAEWVDSAFAKGITCFLLEHAGLPYECTAVERAADGVFYLMRLGVLPEHRSKGYGRALVQRAIDRAATQSGARIEDGIIADHTELQKWCDRLGFEVVGVGHFDHLPFTVNYMSRTLEWRLRTAAGWP